MNEMAKPILLIRFSYNMTAEAVHVATKSMSQIIEDYHIIPVFNNSEFVEIEVYNAVNATDLEIEELKKIVLKQIEK